MLTLFYVLVGLQILAGLYALWDGIRWRRMARRRLATSPAAYSPRVALICPCKGREPGLEHNLAALTAFDYPDYEVFLTLASDHDPAQEVIRQVASKSRRPVQVVVAGPPADCGEKVNNLRAAVERIGEEYEVLVFADSDGRPPRHWLRHLVAPLQDESLGASTTFRWYVPDRGGFWSAFASAWNAPIATLLGDHAHNFCWGGGTAIRRSTFHEVAALDYWRGSVSDDYALTRALRDARRPIHFAPQCLTATFHDTTARGLVEFTNRQIIITRVYSPRLWKLSALAHALYCGTLFLAALLIASEWLSGSSGLGLLPLAALVPLLSVARGALRLLAVSDLLPEWKERLLEYGWAWTLLAPLVPFLYLWNCLVAALTRRITWRGITYELISPNETRVLRR